MDSSAMAEKSSCARKISREVYFCVPGMFDMELRNNAEVEIKKKCLEMTLQEIRPYLSTFIPR
jgi:hypothetical protein